MTAYRATWFLKACNAEKQTGAILFLGVMNNPNPTGTQNKSKQGGYSTRG